MSACSHYLKHDSNDHAIYHVRGTLYQKTGHANAALNDFNKAITIYPNNPLYYEARALLYEEMNNHGLAQQDIEKAQRLKGQ